MDRVFDVAIIGGGINGCGLASDAALRGLSVVLIEKDDLASKTSSSSSKLIHGGLRYLEQYDFKLVKKALDERQTLLTIAPHLVHPIPFILPYETHKRSPWVLRMGLWIYDHLSHKNTLPHSRLVSRKKNRSFFSCVKEGLNKGFLFYDCTTDDARLTVVNALQAKQQGAVICNYTQLIGSEVYNGVWHLSTMNQAGDRVVIQSKVVINAAGPWVESVNALLNIPTDMHLSLVKGSHILLHKLYEGSHAYLLQHADNRVVFMVPYQNHTMVGTTDVAFEGDINSPHISADEVDYLCDLVNSYMNHDVRKEDIIYSWSGFRPLIASSKTLQTISRNYAHLYHATPAPSVAVYGGKITTYRQLASEVIDTLKPVFPDLKNSVTQTMLLPGAAFHTLSFHDYLNHVDDKYHWLHDDVKEHYLKTYGTLMEGILHGASNMSDLGEHFGHGLYQAEVDYLCREEWARCSEDILWRRTKKGLSFSQEHLERLNDYLENVFIPA